MTVILIFCSLTRTAPPSIYTNDKTSLLNLPIHNPQQKNRFYLRSGSYCAAGMQFVHGFLLCAVLSSALPLTHVLEATR